MRTLLALLCASGLGCDAIVTDLRPEQSAVDAAAPTSDGGFGPTDAGAVGPTDAGRPIPDAASGDAGAPFDGG